MATITDRTPGVVRAVQERAARATPAVHVEHLGGWWLRHTDTSAWWTGSVLPHGDAAPDEVARRIAAVERFHASHGTPARFQVSPGACPDGLDNTLAERGYRVESPMSLRSAPTARVVDRPPADGAPVRVDTRPDDAWFEAWWSVHAVAAEPGPDRSMLRRVDRPSAYASALDGTGVIAVGRAVADTGWAGVFGMATLPHARGRGAARQVLAALARWAALQGAAHMYLQVERDNAVAQRLYERAGFTELCAYHYRTCPATPRRGVTPPDGAGARRPRRPGAA